MKVWTHLAYTTLLGLPIDAAVQLALQSECTAVISPFPLSAARHNAGKYPLARIFASISDADFSTEWPTSRVGPFVAITTNEDVEFATGLVDLPALEDSDGSTWLVQQGPVLGFPRVPKASFG